MSGTTPQPGARLEAHDPLGQAIIEYAETFMGDGQPLLTRAAAWVNVTRTFTREQDAAYAALEDEAKVRAQNTDFWRQKAEALERQRDELLAALEGLDGAIRREQMSCHKCGERDFVHSLGVTQSLTDSEAAIASARGQAVR